jgi:hypothetical protein
MQRVTEMELDESRFKVASGRFEDAPGAGVETTRRRDDSYRKEGVAEAFELPALALSPRPFPSSFHSTSGKW